MSHKHKLIELLAEVADMLENVEEVSEIADILAYIDDTVENILKEPDEETKNPICTLFVSW